MGHRRSKGCRLIADLQEAQSWFGQRVSRWRMITEEDEENMDKVHWRQKGKKKHL